MHRSPAASGSSHENDVNTFFFVKGVLKGYMKRKKKQLNLKQKKLEDIFCLKVLISTVYADFCVTLCIYKGLSRKYEVFAFCDTTGTGCLQFPL